MKKRTASVIFLSGVLCMVMALLAACSASSPAPSAPGDLTRVELSMLYFTSGNVNQLKADAIVEAVRRKHPEWAVTSRAAGSEARLIELRLAGEADIFASSGSRQVEIAVQQRLHPDIDYARASEYRTIMPSFLMHVHLFARDESGLQEPSDIVERRYPFRFGSGPGSARETFTLILQHYGATVEDAESWGASLEPLLVVSTEGVEALQSGRIDVALTYAGVPNAFLMGCNAPVRLLPVDDPSVVAMLADWGFVPAVIGAGTYPFVTTDVPTVAVLQSIVVRPGLPDEVVYQILEAVFEHMDLLTAAHAEAEKLITPEFIAAAIPQAERNGEAYHPGALRFYRDMGWVN